MVENRLAKRERLVVLGGDELGVLILVGVAVALNAGIADFRPGDQIDDGGRALQLAGVGGGRSVCS